MLMEHPGLVRGAEVYLNQAPFSFDLSVMDLYTSLLTAGTLVSVTRDELADPRKLYAMLRESGVTMWVSTPAFAQICLVERTFDVAMLPSLKRFWFCGETLPHKTAAGLAARFPEAEIWNTYGPTEATVATTSILVNVDVLAAHDPLPIGKTMPGTRVLVRSEDGTFAADGERGEIIIAGPNVSPGYLARPDLTAQAFSVLDGERCYRTGDRGYASNGLFFFEGRMDFQVKVRGHRIELGDVESHLREVDGVVEAVVLPVERAGVAESLAAFVILRGHTPGTGDFQAGQALRAKAAATLPDYMVPRRFVFVETFPLTPNGKADRKALAAQLAS
jgi:D-alanine--poly(phosphoribitol) ligase subunit 1